MARLWFPLFFSVFGLLATDSRAQELGATVQTNASGAVTNVVFRVWAPNATAVRVSGEFNNWATNAPVLSSNSTTKVWTGSVANARPGQAYKYVITTANNQTLWRKDPRAREVRALDGGVPPYVTGGSSSQASVIYNKDAFAWGDEGFQPPFPNEIVMYELHIGTFHDPRPNDGEPATFYDAVQKLDYLRDLGVNMIALMPVSEFNGRHSWGYNPISLFAIEQAYGGPDGFKHFVNEAHKRGMAVQVDVVHNHYGDLAAPGASDLENFDGGNPYFYHGADETSRPGIGKTKWGPRPRYIDPNVRQFIKDNINMYLDEYKVWALRWDSPRNITGFDFNPGDNVGDPDTTISEAVTMMQEINNDIHGRNIRYYSIAEDANSPGGYSGHWEISFHNVLFPRLLPLDLDGSLPAPFEGKLAYPTLNQRNTDNIGFRLETKEQPGFRVIFSENHDKCGDLNKTTDGARLARDFDPQNPESYAARKKTLLASAVTLSSAGTPMLFQGQEQLADGYFDAYVHLDWLRAARHPGIVRFHRDMIRLRRNLDSVTKALTFTSLPEADDLRSVARVNLVNEAQGWMVYERRTGNAEESIVVVANFSASTRGVGVEFPAAGPWRVLFNSDSTIYASDFGNIGPSVGSSINTSGGNNYQSFDVAPFSVVIFGKSAGPVQLADADANGIDDGWEILFGAANAAADGDQDGFSNLDEFRNGTDPTVPDRASLAGSFNDWNIVTRNARWDPSRSVWRYVARFGSPGMQLAKAYLSSGWVTGADHSFNIAEAGTYEITYHPSTGVYSTNRVDADTNSNGMADAWERFHFYPATTAVASANSDGDAFDNLTEFRRGSEPSEFDQPAMGVVGAYNSWNWQARNMRYNGHGVWTFAVPFLQSPSGANYKFGVGPTQDDANWGQPTAQKPDGFKSEVDFVWSGGLNGWYLVRFNEKNFVTSVTPIAGTADRDGDGMPDSWENYFRLDPFSGNDAAGDADDDQVLNSFEYARLSLPDTADRFAAMHMPGGELWDENDARTRMVWNRDVGRWEFVLHMLSAGNHSFKFMAGTYVAGTWGWDGTGDIPGTSDRWANGNIVQSLGSSGHYLVRFEEVSGNYQFSVLPTGDTDGDGMPDVWEKFHGLQTGVPDALSDKDGDGVRNGLEYARGSNPSFDDHFDDMFVPGDGLWNAGDAARRMTWNAEIGRWEFPLFGAVNGVSRAAELKFSLSTYAAGTWGWGGTPSPGQAVRWANGNVALSLAGRRWHLVRFEEYSARYEIVELSATDIDRDGLPDEWERTIGLSNAAQDSDGDGWSNLNEFVRGSNPRSADPTPKRMTVTGNASPLPQWTPNAYNMTWSDQRARWEWAGTFSTTRAVDFKFSQANADWNGGTSWGAGPTAGVAQAGAAANLSQSVVGNMRYLVHFDDQTSVFGFVRYPVSLDWLTANGLAEMPHDPWTADHDNDGFGNLQEYALGGNPNLRDQTAVPANIVTNVGGSNRLVLRWLERTNKDSGLNVNPELSTSLGSANWLSLSNSVVTHADTNGIPPGHRRKEVSVPLEGNGSFLRLKINGP